MHHLYISNFKKTGWGWLGWLLIFILSSEIAIRMLGARGLIPTPEPFLWHATNVPTKMAYYLSNQPVDVLFLGNSAVLAGVAPSLFDKNRNAGQFSSFNGSLEGLPAWGTYRYAQVYHRLKAPQAIIYGITPQDLNDNSPTGSLLADQVEHAPNVHSHIYPNGLQASLLSYSALYRYRHVVWHWFLSGGHFTEVANIYFDEQGFASSKQRLVDVSPAERTKFVNRDGVFNYDATGEQLEGLRELILFTQRHDIKLTILIMPLANDYYQTFEHPEHYHQYRKTVEMITDEYSVPVWDMESEQYTDLFTDHLYADFIHLNSDGAKELTLVLSKLWQSQVEQP